MSLFFSYLQLFVKALVLLSLDKHLSLPIELSLQLVKLVLVDLGLVNQLPVLIILHVLAFLSQPPECLNLFQVLLALLNEVIDLQLHRLYGLLHELLVYLLLC